MIVYNTTFHIEKDILKESLEYLKTDYIPRAAASGFLLRPRFMRILNTSEDEGVSYSVQFHVKNVDTLNFWLKSEGAGMQKELVTRFGSRIVGFSTLLEEIELER